MRFRILAVLPIATALVYLALELWLRGSPSHPVFLRAEIELVKFLSLVGALAAAFAFGRGEHLRHAWLFMGGSLLLLLVRDFALLGTSYDWSQGALSLVKGGWSVLANVLQVIGTALFAIAWRRSGLMFPGSGWSKGLVIATAILLAAAFAGPTVVANGPAALGGDGNAMVMLASGLGDMISLCLIAPLLLTAVALRGGLLGWPWALLTISYLAWLGYDGAVVVGPALGATRDNVLAISELFRHLGCMFGFSAGLAQRAVVRQMRGR